MILGLVIGFLLGLVFSIALRLIAMELVLDTLCSIGESPA